MPHPPESDRAKAIFGEALDLRGEARSGHLDSACAGDEVLRASVEDLLAAAEQDDGFLRTAVFASGDPREGPGARIGPYRLLEQIGEGGFGVVFMAEQQRPVQRRVALKIIKLGMDTRAVIGRFEQERQALALMDHPNIAKVLDAGATASGRPYFVMDLVKGEPITEFADRGNLTVEDRLRMFLQVCAAVEHAHTKAIIHRDIKPSNVIVREQDGRPLARVIDFGIAKAAGHVGGRLTDKTVFTEFRQLMGTPAYMSPEQASGDLDIDTRSDVYSLGVLLYELLTGVTPFDAQKFRSASLAELQRIIREDEPLRPSSRLAGAAATLDRVAAHRRVDPRRLVPLLKGELDWIIMRAMDKDRARRYQTAGALAADVSRYLAGEAVSAAPPSMAYAARKFFRRHRVGVIAGGAIAATLVLGAGGTFVEYLQARHDRDIARLATQEKAGLLTLAQTREQQARDQAARADREAGNARRQASIASSVNRLLTSTLARADRSKEKGNADLTVREAMDGAVAELDARPGAYEPEVESAVRLAIGRTYSSLSLFKQAEPQLRTALDLRKRTDGEESLPYAEALMELGILETRLMKEDGGTATLSRAVDIRRRLAGEQDDLTIDALGMLGNAYLARNRLADAEPIARDVLRLKSARYGDDDPRTADARGLLATILAQSRRERDALDEFAKALAVYRRHPEGREVRIYSVLGNMAGAHTELGDTAAAIPEFRESLAGLRKLYGPDNQQVAYTTFNFGNALSLAGQFDEADGAYQQAEGIMTRLWGPMNRQVRPCMRARALLLERARRYREAADLAGRLLTLERSERGEDDLVVGRMLMALGASESHLGDPDKGLEHLRGAMAAGQRVGPDHGGAELLIGVRPRLAEALAQAAAAHRKADAGAAIDNLLDEASVLLREHDEAVRVDPPDPNQEQAYVAAAERARKLVDELRHAQPGHASGPP